MNACIIEFAVSSTDIMASRTKLDDTSKCTFLGTLARPAYRLVSRLLMVNGDLTSPIQLEYCAKTAL